MKRKSLQSRVQILVILINKFNRNSKNYIGTGSLEDRVTVLKKGQIAENGTIIYWMSRDQRTQGNWALIKAQGKSTSST